MSARNHTNDLIREGLAASGRRQTLSHGALAMKVCADKHVIDDDGHRIRRIAIRCFELTAVEYGDPHGSKKLGRHIEPECLCSSTVRERDVIAV
jgi:hypothetical protein